MDINALGETIMRKILINMIMLVATALAMSSCEKKVNDWAVDPSHERLFRSLTFGPTLTGDTNVEIGYTQVVSADRYIFEFSKDSLEFNEIVKTVEILADTLTPFAPSTTPTRVLYQTIFEGLDGLSQYSVRMKGISDETGLESDYVQFAFRTAAEQLFTAPEIAVNSITLRWPKNSEVTHVFFGDTLANRTDTGIKVERIDLSAENKADGSITLRDLKAGTVYTVSIYKDDVQRGHMFIRTAGIAGGEVIAVKPGDNITSLAENAVAAGNSDITFVFAGGSTYDLGTVTIPAGVTNVSMTGEMTPTRTKPKVTINSFKLVNTQFGRVIFENLDIYAASGASFLITQEQNGANVAHYSFINCYIERFGNGVVRLNNAVTVGGVTFDNCQIDRNGGWGVVNVGGSEAVVDSIKFTNSTLTDLATQLMDVRVAVKKIAVENCTFYNQHASMAQLLRFDTNRLPLAFVGSNNIIAGTNSGAKLNATSYDHANFSLPVSFAGSYRANEFEIERDSRGFADITLFSGSAADLFVDPDAGDFRIKPGNGFGGRGTAGDPRWFE